MVMLFAGLVVVGGVATFGTAVFYVVSPSDRRLALLRPLSLSTLFAGLGGTANGAVTILTGAAATSAWSERGGQAVLAACAEAVVPLVATCGVLAVSWACAGLGMLRASRS